MQKTGTKMYGTVTNINPVQSSTKGYCQEIFARHVRHWALRIKKLTTGTSSRHLRVLLQNEQCDLPSSVCPVPQRKPTTFKKLPTIEPRTNKKKTTPLIITKFTYLPIAIGESYGAIESQSNNSFL